MRTAHQTRVLKGDLHERIMMRKKKQRLEDELALKEGRLTAEQISRKNGLFSGRHLKLDLKSGGRVR